MFKRGDYAGALRLLQESAEKLPDQPNIAFHVGMANYMVGNEDAARAALKKAAESSADFSGKEEARQRLALLAIDPATANGAAVRSELNSYLQKWPNDPAALTRLAQLQEREGQEDEAIKTYEKVVNANPLFSPATRGLALLYGGQTPVGAAKAFEVATKARQAYPNDPEIAKVLGILSYQRELYPRAVELLREAAAKQPNDGEILFYLGATHHQLKQWNECKTTLEGAASLMLSAKLADEATRTLSACNEMLEQ